MNKYKFPALTVIVIFIVALLVFTSTKVKNIQIENAQNCINSDQVQEKSQIIGKSIFLISENKIQEDLKQINCASSIYVQKKFPSTIIVTPQTKKAHVVIADQPFSLTEDGYVIKTSEGSNLPKVYLPQEIAVAENTKIEDSKVVFALSLVKNLLKSDFTPTQVRFVDNADIIIYSQAEASAMFTINRDAVEQVDSLQSVLSKARIDASKISQIDVRFDKPVVTYKK